MRWAETARSGQRGLVRILLACFEPPGHGGASTATYALFERMQGDGLAVRYLNLVEPGMAASMRRLAGDSFDNPRGLADVHTYILADRFEGPHPALGHGIRRLAPDVVIAVGTIAAFMMKRAAPDVRLIFLTSGCDQMKGYLQVEGDAVRVRRLLECGAPPFHFHIQERIAVEEADLVLTNAELVRELFHLLYPAETGKIYPDVIWMTEWIHEEGMRYAALGLPFERRDIDLLFVASRWDRPEKNFPLVRAIVEAVPDLDAHIIGLLADAPTGATCHGVVPSRRDLFVLMGRARAIVCPSLFDAAPGILFEGAALGCNVVASPDCGNWRLCHDALLAPHCTLDAFLGPIRRAVERRYADNLEAFLEARSYAKLVDIATVF